MTRGNPTEAAGTAVEDATAAPETARAEMPAPDLKAQGLKLLVELGPLIVFFLVNANFKIYAATAAFMVATIVSLIVSRLLFGKVAIMPLVTGVFVLVFGGLTLWLENETFIKVKPTIVNSIFAAILLGGLFFNKIFLDILFGEALRMDQDGWRKLTLRWGLFFIALAVLNELMWRNFSTDAWVSFKTFGIMPLTLIFAMSQVRLIMAHQTPPQP